MNPNEQYIGAPSRYTFTYDLHEFRTINKLVEEHPSIISEYALRWALRFRHDNGLDEHVTKLGKQLLIHVPGFTSWLMKRGA